VSEEQEPAAGTFRAEVRDWLRAHVPAGPQPPVDTAEGWSRAVRADGGWLLSGTKTWSSRAAGRALLELSVAHALQRTQFGRPIGSFQAVKHRLADVAIALEFARPLVAEAADALTEGRATAARDTSAAKVAATDAATLAARAALQVHGAIGYTQEHDLHLWLTKVRALSGAWGSQSAHRTRLLAALAACP